MRATGKKTTRLRKNRAALALLSLAVGPLWGGGVEEAAAEPEAELRFKEGDRVIFVGDTFAERLQQFNYLETMLAVRLADKSLTFRHMGWSADALGRRPRPLNFGPMRSHLRQWDADVIIACFGMAESLEEPDGIEAFRRRLTNYVQDRTSTAFNGRSPARLLLVSPIAHEDLGGGLPDPSPHNEALQQYTRVLQRVAQKHDVPFIDLFSRTKRWYEQHPKASLTFNGIHLTQFGDWVVAGMLCEALGYELPAEAAAAPVQGKLERLREMINRKNEIFFHRWRAVNAEYIYGRRREPFGVDDFPEEMEMLERLAAEKDRAIHESARSFSSVAGRPPRPERVGRMIGPPAK